MYLPAAGAPGPVLLQHTDQWVALLESPTEHPLPGSHNTLLAAVAGSPGQVDLLGIVGQPGQAPHAVFLATLEAGALRPVAGALPPLSAGILAAPGPGRTIYLSGDSTLYHVAFLGAGSAGVSQLALDAEAVRMASTRVVSPASECPGAADLLLLLADRSVLLLPCQAGGHTSGPAMAGPLPAGASTEGRFLAPPAPSLHEATGHFYFMEPAPEGGLAGLWHAAPRQPGQGFLWRRVILPEAALSATVGSLQLARLRTLPEPHPGQWTLVADGQLVLFDTEAFGCATDPSIVCDGPTESTGSRHGWACAPGRARSPFLSADQLCAGCADGFFLDRPADEPPFAAPSHGCLPCPQENCTTCTAEHCLVCAQGFLPEPSGPGGRTACVPGCSAGFAEHPGACLPDAFSPPAATFTLPEWETFPGLPTGTIVTGLGETHLMVAPDSGDLFIPAPDASATSAASATSPAPGTRVLLFTDLGETLLLPAADIARPGAPAPVEVGLLAPGPGEPVVAMAEAGPFRHAGRLALGLVLCDRLGRAFEVWPGCPDAGGPGCSLASPPPRRDLAPGQCLGVRRLDRGHVLLVTRDDQGILLRADPAAGQFVGLGSRVLGMATLPGGPVPARSFLSGPGSGTWEVLSASHSGVSLLPGALPVGDSRREALLGLLAPAAAPMGPSVPVLLDTGFGGAPAGQWPPLPELVLVHTAGPSLQVSRAPGDMLPAGRSMGVPSAGQTLGPMPGPVADTPGGPGLLVQPVSLPWQQPHYPAGLLLLGRTFFALVPLYCPAPPGGPCVFLRPTVLPLSAPMHVPDSAPNWQPAIIRAPSAPGHVLTMVTFAEAVGPISVSLQVACPAGAFGLACEPCHGACRECTGPGPGDCTACTLALASAPDECMAACPAGLLADLDAGRCTCDTGCLDCEADPHPAGAGGYRCTECSAGYLLVDDPAQPGHCLPCDRACAGCTAAGDPAACTACAAGWLLHAGACVDVCPAGHWPDPGSARCAPCLAECATCSGPDSCTGCPAGHHVGPDGLCHRCDLSCAECQQAGSCTVCQPGLVFLQANAQVPSLCGPTCLPGQFAGATRCTACHRSCALCTGEATRCQVCAVEYGWASAPAPAPGPPAAPCLLCEMGCTSCLAGRCLTCEESLFLTPEHECWAFCMPGFYPNGESCQPCDPSCGECRGPGLDECLSCPMDLLFQESLYPLGTCQSGCPDGYFLQADSQECLPCHAACSRCNGPSEGDCWQCRGDALLQGTHCVQACAPGHVAVGDRCLPCHASCAECTGVWASECTACSAGLLPLPAGGRPDRCVAGCPVGYHTGPDGCTRCSDDQCASCPGEAAACGLCTGSWLLAGQACLPTCPADSLPQGNVCTVCHDSCEACYGPGPGHCLSCSAAFPLMVEGHCRDACPAGTFPDAGTCLPCHGLCSTCHGPEPGHCATCPAGGLLHGGFCLAECPAAFFPQAGACHPCQASCATCDNRTTCATCPEGELLQPGGTCAKTCPAGWHGCAPDPRCRACPEGCAACRSVGGTCQPECTACSGGLLLSAGQCVAQCAGDEYVVAGTGTCAACSAACRTCLAAADKCTSCPAGRLLHPPAGACLDVCPPGSAPAGGTCLACVAGCDRCEAGPGQEGCDPSREGFLSCPEIAGCLRCAGGLLLLNGAACVDRCPGGFFADARAPAGPMCRACDPACAACSGPGPDGCLAPPGSRASRIGLAVGLSMGLLILLILLLLLVLLCVRRRHKAHPVAKAAADAEDATMLSTLLELVALPGALVVAADVDFRPLEEEEEEEAAPPGAGGPASVYSAQAVSPAVAERLACPAVVAIKKPKSHPMPPTQQALFHNEVALMWQLRGHGNIVRLFGYSHSPPAIVMERFDSDLLTLLRSGVPLSPVHLADIIHQWATGLEAMHASGLAHGDLSPANVLVSQGHDGAWRAALGHLGASRNFAPDRPSALLDTMPPDLHALTVCYAGPEVIAAFHQGAPLEPGLRPPADIYAAAVMLNECIARAAPWPGMGLPGVMAAVLAGQRPGTDALPLAGPFAEARHLIAEAWHAEASRRPDAGVFRQRCAALHVAAGGPATPP
ncbi:serine/threonine protein kinase [Fonticula alba]|uniref:Serine/threonine protein kinase n=1 Tax=Fonticula alba TaxID=691883 RepID=A0A058Z1W5_FONAL|nr:serine/threonine protein kinase [Fonticula alba]KCV68126.1 serine/threonine protein kinase [Fonticula alba]|eukprot:XP_009497500.1 serine/threonine protein kinase [Fonticula alba]